MLHLPVRRTLLKFNPKTFKTLTGLLDVGYGDGDVTEAAAGIAVAGRVALEVRV